MYDNPESWYALGEIDPVLDEHLKTLENGAPKFPADVHVHRKLSAESARKRAENQDARGVVEEESFVEARDGYQIPIRIHSPDVDTGPGPLIVFNHGGGFCVGTLDTDIIHPRSFVRRLGAVVVAVDYRLAPEHPFPTGVLDSWDVVQWAAKNAQRLKADPSKGFIVGGVSAGGGFSTAIGRLARDSQLTPRLTGLCLLIPPTFGSETAIPEKYKSIVKSYDQNRKAPFLPEEDIRKYLDAYKPDEASPLFNNFAPGVTLANLPPVYLQICGMDPLRDEALIYEQVVRIEHKIQTRMDVYPGLPHGFWIAFPEFDSSKKFLEDSIKGAEWLLTVGRKAA